MANGCIQIGTSGWNYDSWKRGNFYPEGVREQDLLREYTRHISSVEINRSFYLFPTPTAVADWYAQTPADFVFACKSSRFLSHRRKLKEPVSDATTALHSLEIEPPFPAERAL
jgi:uncharacterized protein YecE (DUF72 family)